MRTISAKDPLSHNDSNRKGDRHLIYIPKLFLHKFSTYGVSSVPKYVIITLCLA